MHLSSFDTIAINIEYYVHSLMEGLLEKHISVLQVHNVVQGVRASHEIPGGRLTAMKLACGVQINTSGDTVQQDRLGAQC